MRGRKGHILILVENLPIPFDRRVWMEAMALTESGYKVSVISPCPLEETQTPNRVIEGVHVFRYPMPDTTSSKFSFIKEFAFSLGKRPVTNLGPSCTLDKGSELLA